MRKILTIIFLLGCFALSAQEKLSEKEKIAQLEEQRAKDKQNQINKVLDSAVYLFEQEAYTDADKKFVYVLQHIKSVPSDLAYYFGKNSYYLNKFKQSIDWLNKYIQLKGASGRFSEDAVVYLKKSEAKVLEERQLQVQQTHEILSRDYDIDCGPSGKVTCPVCSGSTVVIKKGYLGDTYKVCTYCHKTGYLSCEEYNKLIRGQLKANQ